MVIIIGAIILAACVIAAVTVMQSSRVPQKTEEELERERIELRKKENHVCKSCYQYLNRMMNLMTKLHNQNKFDTLEKLADMPSEIYENKDMVMNRLDEEEQAHLRAFLESLQIEKQEDEKISVMVKDCEGLKKTFYDSLLPFYPYFYKEMADGRVRYSSLVNQKMLGIYRKLTGKRFRLGYQNKHNTGVAAFTREKERYQVYDKEGNLLCDASFVNGKFDKGYAVKPPEKEDPDWTVIRSGEYVDGVFNDTSIKYIYEKEVQ